jgi:iron complex transport system substrate-binding protein
VRIWSLLPSATEILFALGLGEQVTGVTHECDYPPEAATKPRVTISYIDSSRPSAEIDRQVTERFRSGQPLYGIVEEELRRNPPDVIVTQDLCPVCAVSPSDFSGHLEASGCRAGIVTLNPNLLEDVLENVMQVGEATGRQARAKDFVRSLRRRIDEVRAAVEGAPRPRVLCLEWLDPPMPGGHWLPQMVEIAGGNSEPIAAGEPSRKLPWEVMRAFEPEVIVLLPCGFDAERAAREAACLGQLDGWLQLPALRKGRVYAVNANAYFSRPGPRLVDGLEMLARLLHPERWPQPPPEGTVLKLVSPPAGSSSVENWAPRFEATLAP